MQLLAISKLRKPKKSKRRVISGSRVNKTRAFLSQPENCTQFEVATWTNTFGYRGIVTAGVFVVESLVEDFASKAVSFAAIFFAYVALLSRKTAKETVVFGAKHAFFYDAERTILISISATFALHYCREGTLRLRVEPLYQKSR